MSKNFNRPVQQQQQNRTRVNDYIRVPNVMLIKDGENLGVVPTDTAKRMAKEAGLDLVEVVADKRPPICKIMDYDKYRYELALKEKNNKKKQKQNQLKELRFSPSIEENDLLMKANQAIRFLKEGHKVQLRLVYQRRENAHKELGFPILEKAIQIIGENGVVTQKPKIEGSNLNCIIDPPK